MHMIYETGVFSQMYQCNNVCYGRRDDPRDALVLRVDQEHKDLSSLPPQRSVIYHCIMHFAFIVSD